MEKIENKQTCVTLKPGSFQLVDWPGTAVSTVVARVITDAAAVAAGGATIID